ncbi:MAG: class I SAM-dependent methyltransferase [Anaerolineaceae bacterium]|nr:class I SAM-dependent methyltransferase [Anaerolineaceae bacterium]
MSINMTRENLKSAYNLQASSRDSDQTAPWKLKERAAFLSRLQHEKKRTLLEIGAGPGRDSLFFQQADLQVICTDLSLAMTSLSRSKGLDTCQMDLLRPAFPANSFEALFALNCLLHIPKNEIQHALQSLHRCLKPDGLLFLGLYGGKDFEGIYEKDHYNPKRFFSFHTDEQMRLLVKNHFELLYFKTISQGEEKDFHFQSMILRKSE